MKLRKGFLNLVVLVTLALSFSQTAHAQSKTFTFDFSDYGFDLTGTLVAASNGDGSYTANSGSLTVDANSSSYTYLNAGTFQLAPSGSGGGYFGTSDNLLYPAGNSGSGTGTLTRNGLLFGDPNGYYIQVQGFAPGIDWAVDPYGGGAEAAFTLHSAAVPELSSMLGFGSFVALGGLAILRRRQRTANA